MSWRTSTWGIFVVVSPSELNSVLGGDRSATISTFDVASEYEADKWAWQSLFKVAEKTHKEVVLSVHVPCIYFVIFGLAKAMYTPRERLGQYITETHPDPWERASRLIFNSPDDASRSPGSFAKAIIDLRRILTDEYGTSAFQGAAQLARSRLHAPGSRT
jgi:hypothetical protein